MRNSRRILASILVLALAAVLGCVTEPEHKTPTPPAAPLNSTPEGAVLRFVWAYENKKAAEYENLFTEDFNFKFSTSADPILAQEYPDGWSKIDEATSAQHLFQGFTDDSTGYHPASSGIDLTFAKTLPSDDPDAQDPAKFKVLATRVDGLVVVPPTDGQTEETRYVIDNNFHRFYLVRGDAAGSLAAGQPADSTHWYVWKWQDESTGYPAPAALGEATRSTTWSSVKATYR